MKKVKILALAFVIGSATLFAYNPPTKQIPPNTNKITEDDCLTKKQIPVNSVFLDANSKDDAHTILSMQESKRILEENKHEAIKNYSLFMPDIVGKE